MIRNKLNKTFMNIIIQCVLMLNFLAPLYSLPHLHLETLKELERKPRADYEPTGSVERAKRHDCSEEHVNVENCQEDIRLSEKVLMCLDNCANCVKQWRTGVYNGRHCANDCMQQLEEPKKESLDPDCNLVKYFNSTVLINSQS